MKKYYIFIKTPVVMVEADTEAEAIMKATARVDEIAGSNDGSEFLANAKLYAVRLPT